MTNLLYVCKYNIDRSPVAEVITKQKVRTKTLGVSSAGLRGNGKYPTMGITMEMRTILKERGYNFWKHDNQTLIDTLLQSQDLILCMKKVQVAALLEEAPSLEGKIYTLPAYAGFEDEEIHSPSYFIKKVPGYSMFSSMPYCVRDSVYSFLGCTDRRDCQGVLSVHRKMVENIEEYVSLALKRMSSEKLI
jgi:protein-tyrosine-phosphatase